MSVHFGGTVYASGIPLGPVSAGGRMIWGNIYFVDGDSGSDSNSGTDRNAPLLTINAAYNKCTDGHDDYIFVRGRLDEALIITKSKLHIIGCSYGPAMQGMARWNNASTGAVSHTCQIKASDVEIAGLRIGGGSGGAISESYSPIYIGGENITSAHRCWIHHCNVGDYDQDHSSALIGYGIAIDGSYQNVIEHNYVTYCDSGIAIIVNSSGATLSSNHNIIQHNMVVNCDNGIYVREGAYGQVYHNYVDKGDAQNDDYGIWVNGTRATVVENWITGGYTKPWGDASSIGHNNYEDTTSAAIVLAQSEA